MNIVYCGFGRAGKECLEQLLKEDGITPDRLLVYTHEHSENEDFLKYLNTSRIEYSLNDVSSEAKRLKEFHPEVLLSVYYRLIIRRDILSMVSYRAMNLHPSLLPDYKGCLSSVWAIINGEKETGITYHYMNDRVDAGNIILQKCLAIDSNDTAYSLYHKLVTLFVALFSQAFQRLRDKDPGTPQQNMPNARTYRRVMPFGGVIDSDKVSFKVAQRIVRAFYFPPYEPVKIVLGNRALPIANVEELEKFKDCFKE